MTSHFRYPGAQPFQTDQRDIFFGREGDVEKLYELLSLEELIVLYSKSGLGKSSLLNAGLIPRIQKDNKQEAILIRFGAYTEDKTELPSDISFRTIRNKIPAHPLLEQLFEDDNSLWYQAKTRQLQKKATGCILIFDQFEELLTYPEEAVLIFKDQLAELLHTEIPNRFREKIEKIFEKGTNGILTDEELDLLHQPLEIKIILAIRSDRMSLLNHLTDVIPSILKTCYELGPLSTSQAEEAILNPAYKKDNRFVTPPFDYEDAAIEKIFNYLTFQKKDTIESFQLQILCQALEQKVLDHQLKVIKESDIEDIDIIYGTYYQNQINRISDVQERLAARKLIEEALILEEEERRLSLYEGQIYRTYGFSPQLLKKLVDVRLLRAEPSLKGGYTYELTHDTIVGPILKAKQQRVKQEKQIEAAEAKKERERELEILREQAAIERRKRLQNRTLAILGFTLALVALLSTFNAYHLFKAAEGANNQLTLELSKRIKAEYFRLIAEGNQFEGHYQFGDALALYDSAFYQIQAYPEIDSGGTNTLKAKERAKDAQNAYQQFQQVMELGNLEQEKGTSSYPKALNQYKIAFDLAFDQQLQQTASNKIEALEIKMEEAFATLVERGDLYQLSNDYERACFNFKRAKQLKPNNRYVLSKLSNCK